MMPNKHENTLVHETVLPVPIEEVWRSFTTAEGQEAWNVAHARVELELGGAMQTHYRAEGVLGDEGTIENTILSFDPPRMISFQVTRCPKGFPFPNAVKVLWHVLYFTSIDATQTKVTLRGLGYTEDAESQQMREFFQKGNEATLQAWKAYLTRS